MLAAGDQKRIDQPFTRDQRPAGALELGIEKAEIERRIVDDKRRVAEKGDQVVGRFDKKRLVLEEFARSGREPRRPPPACRVRD